MNDGRMLGRAIIGKAESEAPGLVDALLAAVRAQPQPRVLAVTGPPHSGKSRVVAEFVRRCGVSSFNLALTEDDTTLFAFIFALVRSMGPIARGAQLSFNAMQARLSTYDDIPRIVGWLCSHINAEAWVAVDNVELLGADPLVVELLLAMVERCPSVRWLFAGRSTEALPIDAWIAQDIAGSTFVTADSARPPVTRLLTRLDATEQTLLAAVAPLRTLDVQLVDAILGEAGTLLIRRLYERAPALFEVGGFVRLHRDVRRALLNRLAEKGDGALQAAVTRCGAALEAFELYEELLHMYLRNGAHAQLEDVLARRGLALADHVNADTLEAALRVVSGESPGARSLHAILASRRGHYDVAESLFEGAARSASQPLSATIQYAYGCYLLRRNRADSASVFEHLLNENVPGAAHQSEIRSALAQSYVLCDRRAAALEQIKFALHLIESAPDPSTVKTRAAYVYFYAARDLMLAERIASDALAQALQARSYTVAVGAASLLYNIACERDRPGEAIAALNVLADCGIKLGNVAFQSYAVIAMLEYHVEAGNLAEIARAREALRSFDISHKSLAASEALVTAEAMQRSWRGEFDSAYELLEPTAAQAVGDDYRVLREAELAFFAAAAHRTDASRRHFERACAGFPTMDSATHKAVRARILLGVAAAANGDGSAAHEQFACCAEIARHFPRLASVRDAALLLHDTSGGNELREALARMRACGAGGFALTFIQLARSRRSRRAPAPRPTAGPAPVFMSGA